MTSITVEGLLGGWLSWQPHGLLTSSQLLRELVWKMGDLIRLLWSELRGLASWTLLLPEGLSPTDFRPTSCGRDDVPEVAFQKLHRTLCKEGKGKYRLQQPFYCLGSLFYNAMAAK
jgi:hypothetical protein